VTMPLLALSAAGVLVLEGCLRFSAAANASEKRVR
jgi:hypothetical protein